MRKTVTQNYLITCFPQIVGNACMGSWVFLKNVTGGDYFQQFCWFAAVDTFTNPVY